MREKMATTDDIADVRSEINSLRADVASDLLALEKRLNDQIAGLRRAVMTYHSSAIGRGVLLTSMSAIVEGGVEGSVLADGPLLRLEPQTTRAESLLAPVQGWKVNTPFGSVPAVEQVNPAGAARK